MKRMSIEIDLVDVDDEGPAMTEAQLADCQESVSGAVCNSRKGQAFIRSARQYIPALISEIQRLKSERSSARSLREDRGKTMGELARFYRCSTVEVSDSERGKYKGRSLP